MDEDYRRRIRSGEPLTYREHLRAGWEPSVGPMHGPPALWEVECALCGNIGIRFSDCCLCEECLNALIGHSNYRDALEARRISMWHPEIQEIGSFNWNMRCYCHCEESEVWIK